ncbi:MAG: tryptophan--tRNA ligase [Rickettsiaceae bacterium]
MSKVAVSGAQTSGSLHLGNYLGSIKNWVTMQDDYNCYFFLADLHSITVEQAPGELQKSILNSAATYLAAGLDPNKSALFLQSTVKEHCELAWILNCVTPIGWLKRMTQFKDKAGKTQDNANTGLFTYPVLMAADILLYNADVVPVGDDQKQHLELTRDIAGVINRKFGQELLKVPEPVIQGYATRVMSLRDGTKKMSKSDPSDASRINITDDPDTIIKKIKKSKTDSIEAITYDPNNRPEVTNLLNIFCALANKDKETIMATYQSKGFASFKSDLAEVIITHLQPIKTEFDKIIKDKEYICKSLTIGSEKARQTASLTCNRLMQSFGLKLP